MNRKSPILLLIVALLSLALAATSHAQTPPNDPSRGHTGDPNNPGGPGDYGTPPTQAFEEFTIRLEPALGSPRCPVSQQDADHCDPVGWLSTRSQNFVNIMGDAYLRGSSEVPQGVQMTSSFVASQDDTNVAVQFSAEAFVEDDNPGANRRMFVRALVDGQVVNPSDVVFAKTDHEGAQSFIFTTNVGAGIHTVEIQWRVDTQATGYMRDASLLVRMGRDEKSAKGTFTTKTAPSGLNQTHSKNAWADVPNMSLGFYSPADGTVTASFSAEAWVTNGKRFALRALLDGAPMAPSDVIFVNANNQPSSQAMTFGMHGVAAGNHTIKLQWLVDDGGTANVGDRTIAISALSARGNTSHGFVAAPSGESIETPKETGWPIDMKNMSLDFEIPATGNGEVAVQFSAEIGTSGDALGRVGLEIDDELQLDGYVQMADGSLNTAVRSFVFEAKGLKPGKHTAQIIFGSDSNTGGQVFVGDRTMTLMSATGFIPDLAEAPKFSGGHIGKDSDYIAGIEPLIGSRPVLAILIDPNLCDATSFNPQNPCYNEYTLPKGKVDQAVFGTSAEPGFGAFEEENMKSWLEANSGGRYTIVRAGAGIAGWYEANEPSDAYYNHPKDTCVAGFNEGGLRLIAEAVKQSNADVDYSDFDIDNDGRVDAQELGILVIIPRSTGGDGSSIQPLYAQNCDGPTERMELDGVELPRNVAKWNANFDDNVELRQFVVGVHEYLHLVGGTDDLYLPADVSTFPRDMTVMSDFQQASSHLDPLYKMAFGWVTPVIVNETKEITVSAVAKSNTVYILPRYDNPWEEEYYVLENRKNNMGFPWFDSGINDSGIAVWHIVSDRIENQQAPIGTTQAAWNASHIPSDNPTSQGQMGRNGIRLIRPFDDVVNGTALFNDKEKTLWDKGNYALESGGCILIANAGDPFKNQLAWADCEESGYNISWGDFAAENMKVKVVVE